MREDDNEDFISYGTPLPEIEEEHVLRKKAAKELEVRDERGRQRFHGAFTGGFSAGYFNTVGTKEGWAPSTFISSRDKPKEGFSQKPEDFMDDEDFGEFGIATRRIHTTSQFKDASNLKSTKRKFDDADRVIPGEAPLMELVKPVCESIGIKILNKLGWKMGQGVGPRVKKHIPATRTYGCSLPDTAQVDVDDPFACSYTFAPEDVEAQLYHPKDDVFGLGYSGLSKESVLSAHVDHSNPTSTKSWLKKDKKKLAISGQAFGVGAFEDDDDDIYGKDDMSQYDFSELNPIDSVSTSKSSGNKQNLTQIGAVLEGFHLSTEAPPAKQYYAPPTLPPNYNPFHVKEKKAPVQSTPVPFSSRHTMSANDRSFLIGEKKFQAFPINVNKSKSSTIVPQSVTNASIGSSHSFRPFPNDQAKQARYEEYLRLKEIGDLDKLQQPPTLTEWEKQQEVEEFARAAVLFKPLSAALSSRFESRSSLSVEHEVMDALAKARKGGEKKTAEKRKLVGQHNRKSLEWHPVSLLCKRFNVPNPYPDSADAPTPQKSKSLFEDITFLTEGKISKNEAADLSVETNSSKTDENSDIKEGTTTRETIVMHTADNTKKSEESKHQLPESTRPPIDFFKDIFENSSDEDDSSNQPPAQSSEPPQTSEPSGGNNEAEDMETGSEPPEQASRSSDPPAEKRKTGFGVFANLDLDALNQRPLKPKSDVENDFSASWNTSGEASRVANFGREVEVMTEQTVQAKDDLNGASREPNQPIDLYGPELPPDFNESSTQRLQQIEVRKHSKHKSKHKHKHHKHKSKKKKKKHSSHKSSEDSSVNSDEDIPNEVIIEKLKKLQRVLKGDLH